MLSECLHHPTIIFISQFTQISPCRFPAMGAINLLDIITFKVHFVTSKTLPFNTRGFLQILINEVS